MPKLVQIYSEFYDFTFKTNKDVDELTFCDENGDLTDEIILFLIKVFNLDSDVFSDIKKSVFDIIVTDFEKLNEF